MLPNDRFLASLEARAGDGPVPLRRGELLRLLRLAGCEDTDAYRCAAADPREDRAMQVPDVRALVAMAREGAPVAER